MSVTIQQVKAALELVDFDAETAQRKMAPISRAIYRPAEKRGQARLGGVLVLLFCKERTPYLLLTRRRDDLPAHAGQVSFPGGRNEAPESLWETAVRETEEEVGIDSPNLHYLGTLTPIYVPPSDYEVHPFVAWYNSDSLPVFTPAPREVAEIIETPLSVLLDPASRVEERRDIGGQQLMVPYFAVEGHKVWGATAVMLSELVERLRVIHRRDQDPNAAF